MENRPDGQEHSAAWHVLKNGHLFDPIEDHMFVSRHMGKQIMEEVEAKRQAQAQADQLEVELRTRI